MLTTAADYWFSRCVRERANWTCERCGKIYHEGNRGIHCAHYETRDNWAVRFEPLNAFCLCHGCHEYFDKGRRFEFRDFYLMRLGQDCYDILNEKSLQSATFAKQAKREKKEIAKHYKAEYDRMLAFRMGGKTGRIEFSGYF